MLASLKRTIKLINKDDFDIALFKLVSEEDTDRPKDKHLNLVVACLKGENKRILPLDAFTRITDRILEIRFARWNSALKWCYVLHVCIYSDCKVFVEAMCSNNLFGAVRQSQSQGLPSDDVAKFLHMTLTLNYFSYLQNRYENLLYFQNAMDDFNQKEETQKSLIIAKVVSTIFLILKMEKDLQISVEKFNLKLIKCITFFVLRDLIFFYMILNKYVTDRLDSIKSIELALAQRIYQNYTDLIKITRHVKQMLFLRVAIHEAISKTERELLEDITLFQVNPIKNREIELYFRDKESSPVKPSFIQNIDVESRGKLLEKFHTERVFSKKNSYQPQEQNFVQEQTKIQPTSRQEQIKEELKLDLRSIVIDQEKESRAKIFSFSKKGTFKEDQPQTKERPEPIEIVQFNDYGEPEKIKAPKIQKKPVRIQVSRMREPEGFGDATTYQSATTQQSFMSEYSENRVLGLTRQNSAAKTVVIQNHFYKSRESPLNFYRPDVINRQSSSGKLGDNRRF